MSIHLTSHSPILFSFSSYSIHPLPPFSFHFAFQCTTSPHRHSNGESTGARTLWVWSAVKTAIILSLVLWKPRELELVSCDAMCLISLQPINRSASADWMVLNQFLSPNGSLGGGAGKEAGVEVILSVVSEHLSLTVTLSFVCFIQYTICLLYVYIYLTDTVFVYRAVIEATAAVLQRLPAWLFLSDRAPPRGILLISWCQYWWIHLYRPVAEERCVILFLCSNTNSGTSFLHFKHSPDWPLSHYSHIYSNVITPASTSLKLDVVNMNLIVVVSPLALKHSTCITLAYESAVNVKCVLVSKMQKRSKSPDIIATGSSCQSNMAHLLSSLLTDWQVPSTRPSELHKHMTDCVYVYILFVGV